MCASIFAFMIWFTVNDSMLLCRPRPFPEYSEDPLAKKARQIKDDVTFSLFFLFLPTPSSLALRVLVAAIGVASR